MDGDGKNGHVNQGLGQALQTINLPVSSFISQHNTNPAHSANETVVLQIQQLLEQLNGRGLNSMLVVVDPVGNVSIHGSEKGQLFLKDNADIADRFAKICSDKPNGMNQTEDDLIKEMLSSTAIPEGLTIKPVGNAKKSPKAKFVESDKSDAAKKKRERRPETWQRNIKKKLKTEGREYDYTKRFPPQPEKKKVDQSSQDKPENRKGAMSWDTEPTL
ncbi:hypothetical protein MAR_028396 [Mya arenaria]|uniref:Uncharacterized protein n=1 Tax=Mya arenaria TaxID=6604 RepID=A0ABY7DGH1_MYAAR|nr:hypothetical protein MAR_028396 [Mya arenaria]